MLARRAIVLAALVGGLALGVGCSGGATGGARPDATNDTDAPDATDADGVVRLGYTAELTQVPALVGIEKGIFDEYLAPEVRVELDEVTGSEAVGLLLEGSIDAAYLGPQEAIDAYSRSGGKGVRIVAGATSGGAALVVRPGIVTVADLEGASLAVPRFGRAQDVALRAFLVDNGLQVAAGEGAVAVIPQESDRILAMFRSGAIAGAWVPEPWATSLVLEAGGTVLADERSLWPEGEFATTELVVRTEFLAKHRESVKRLLDGHVRAVTEAAENPAEAQRAANAVIRAQTGSAIADDVITQAWDNLTFTNDPIEGSLQKSADDASRVGTAKPIDVAGLFDLTLLNQVLAVLGLDGVSS